MQLTIQDVSKLLDISESTTTRWIKQRGLPAQHVGGQYRFNRSELLEWARANSIRLPAELFDNLQEEAPPNLAEALQAGGICYDLPAIDKSAALRSLVSVLPLPEDFDRELLFQLLLAREASASTGVGDGIALPHVRNPVVLQVPRPLVTLCFLQQPVEFGALDGKPVHVLFSLISPTVRSHLQLLARLSFALHDTTFKQAILRAAPREEILEQARRAEAQLARPAARSGNE